jgi:hypothetical protein
MVYGDLARGKKVKQDGADRIGPKEGLCTLSAEQLVVVTDCLHIYTPELGKA